MLLSGGLDSALAARLLLERGIEISALHISHPWEAQDPADVKHLASELGVSLKEMRLGNEMIDIIRAPAFGHGRYINPCIDCKIAMLKKAKEYMGVVGASFVATGEVIGQRPMSQMRRTLDVIEQRSSLQGILLRPLSARCLKPTRMEEEGIIDRKKLGDIAGRSRKQQLMLARRYGIVHYRTPAGGCLLTDKAFARRLTDLLENERGVLPEWRLRLLAFGRHFRVDKTTVVVVGRNEAENSALEQFSAHVAEMLIPEFTGPSACVLGEASSTYIRRAIGLIASYTNKKNWDKADTVAVMTKQGPRVFAKEHIRPEEVREKRGQWHI